MRVGFYAARPDSSALLFICRRNSIYQIFQPWIHHRLRSVPSDADQRGRSRCGSRTNLANGLRRLAENYSDHGLDPSQKGESKCQTITATTTKRFEHQMQQSCSAINSSHGGIKYDVKRPNYWSGRRSKIIRSPEHSVSVTIQDWNAPTRNIL